ncbi:MAG: ABC transporter ATP-binding protein [Arachidicoccus sp.]|nr:ABC transporter ATP-binding protein [Arachidicoccus sp.]
MHTAIKIENLSFRYPKQSSDCFSNLNLEIPQGARFGLFGPNGAGKTTLMNLMTGVLDFSEGNIFMFDKSVKAKDKEVKKLFGFVPQDFSFYQELSPVENLEFFGAWAGLNKNDIKNRTENLLNILGLSEVKNKPVEKFSGGMKRKVNLAIGVIHQPKILFLDEPTVGVDVQSRHEIIHYLKQLNEQGTTLVYTSHQLNEAEKLCNKIALLDEGRIIANDDLDKLLQHHAQSDLELLFLNLTGKEFS